MLKLIMVGCELSIAYFHHLWQSPRQNMLLQIHMHVIRANVPAVLTVSSAVPTFVTGHTYVLHQDKHQCLERLVEI